MVIQSQGVRTFFTCKNVSATGFIYNDIGGNNATTGWIACESDRVLVQVGCATKLSSGSLTYRIEGKFHTLDRVASIDTGTYSAKSTIDKVVIVDENLEQIRLGVKNSIHPSSPLASPCIFYAGILLTDSN
jgi:hypothetical protein